MFFHLVIFVRFQPQSWLIIYFMLHSCALPRCHLFNSYSASHDNWCTGTLWNRVITAQCEGMGEVGSARYEPALLPPCPSIRALCYTVTVKDPPNHTSSLRVKLYFFIAAQFARVAQPMIFEWTWHLRQSGQQQRNASLGPAVRLCHYEMYGAAHYGKWAKKSVISCKGYPDCHVGLHCRIKKVK